MTDASGTDPTPLKDPGISNRIAHLLQPSTPGALTAPGPPGFELPPPSPPASDSGRSRAPAADTAPDALRDRATAVIAAPSTPSASALAEPSLAGPTNVGATARLSAAGSQAPLLRVVLLVAVIAASAAAVLWFRGRPAPVAAPAAGPRAHPTAQPLPGPVRAPVVAAEHEAAEAPLAPPGATRAPAPGPRGPRSREPRAPLVTPSKRATRRAMQSPTRPPVDRLDRRALQERVLAAKQAFEARADGPMVAKLSRLLLDLSLREPTAADRALLATAERRLR